MNTFEKQIEVRWQDCDPNRHVRHSAYYNYGAHARIRFFTEVGFGAEKMNRLQIGPILFKEECNFIRELSMEETIRVNFLRGAIAENGSRFILHHEIFNSKNEKCAHITVKGAWMDLTLRKLTIPPAALAAAIHQLSVGEAYIYQSKNKKG